MIAGLVNGGDLDSDAILGRTVASATVAGQSSRRPTGAKVQGAEGVPHDQNHDPLDGEAYRETYRLVRDDELNPTRERMMYSVVRRYTGAGPLAKAMVERHRDVEEVLRGVPGFRAYYAMLTPSGTVATITVCDDQAGTAESTRRAAAWIQKNLAGVSVSPVEITEGAVFLSL